MKTVQLAKIAEINPKTVVPSDTASFTLFDFVPMADVSEEGLVNATTQRPYSEVQSGFTTFRHGDLLVAKITPCFENNKIAQATITTEIGFGSTEFHVIRCNGDALHAPYALHFLRSDVIRAAGKRRMTGSAGQQRVPKKFLEELSIPLPPLDEQKRIAAILDQADEIRRKRQHAIDRLNQLGQAIFHEMFGDPVSNPMGWPVRELGQIGNLDRGISKHRPRNDPALLGGDHPLIQTGDVANADGYIRAFEATYSDIGLKQSRKWPVGTLCITIAANIGKTAILDIEACFPDSVVGFLPSGDVTAEYVQYWMAQIQKRLEEVAPQSAQKNINLAILRELPVPTPPKVEQDLFTKIISETERHKSVYRTLFQASDKLFASLQHRAFRGKL